MVTEFTAENNKFINLGICPCRLSNLLEGEYKNFFAMNPGQFLKHLHLCSIFLYIRTHAELYRRAMRAKLKSYSFSLSYEHEHVMFIHVESDAEHTSLNAIHATYHNP